MTLEEKGPIVPPPVLIKFPQQVSKEIQSWEDIISATHWEIGDSTSANGADFYLGKAELGHIHLTGEVHIPTGKPLADLLIKAKFAQKFPYGNDWIIHPINTKEDVLHALWLFKLNYNRIKGEPFEKLSAAINSYQK